MGSVSKACFKHNGISFLERIHTKCMRANIEEWLVMLGPTHFEEDVQEAKRLKIPYSLNPDAMTGGMASSISSGFSLLSKQPLDALFLWPVDVPFVEANTLDVLISKYVKGKVLVPHYNGKAGHPPLIGQDYFEDFRKSKSHSLGAKGVMRSVQNYVAVPVEDPWVLKDIDQHNDLI